MEKIKNNKKNMTFLISVFIVGFIVVFGTFFPKQFSNIANKVYDFCVNNFSWMYMLAMLIFILFCLFMLLSKYGKVVLGKDGEKAEYGLVSWFAMLFSAGMGIGLVFWGVAEPLSHFVNPIKGIDPGSIEAQKFALRTSFLHWGIHPWANYVVLSLALAYMQFRKNKPGLISSIFIPIFGDGFCNKPLGRTIDILAIFATVAGLATSLGLGAFQINSGLNYLFGIPESTPVVVGIVAITTIAFIWTAVAGIDKGIKTLSNANVAIAVLILTLAIAVGPSLDIFKNMFSGIGGYIKNLPIDSLPIVQSNKKDWIGGWTIFYWAWWIAWAPFVSTFIARISKGRTIREFVLGVLLAPTIFSIIWFSVFGTLGFDIGFDKAKEVFKPESTAFFKVMGEYNLGSIISIITVIVLFTFFVTSANSGTYVLGMLSSEGNQNPTNKRKIVWGILIAAVTLVLMTSSSNGLQMLQTISISAAFPLAIVMIFAIVAILKVLKTEEI